MHAPALLACHDCDLLQRPVALPPGGMARCARCQGVLYRSKPGGLDRTLAFSLGAAVLFIIANSFPIVGLEAAGFHSSTTLFGTVRTLYDDDMASVAGLVFVTTILMPGLGIAAFLYLLLPLKLGWVPRGLPAVFRVLHAVRPWGMVEVFMLGTLVALTKLAALASVVPGIALWCFAILMILIAAAAGSFDTHEFWARVEETR
jgi:paraquat-inducible protein A